MFLHRALVEMCNGAPAPLGFNDSFSIFPLKGSMDEDTAFSVNRTADCTRPLGLKICDNKAIAGAVNYAITPAISKWADNSQNGFVGGRQGLDNNVTLDVQSRIQDHIASASQSLPVDRIPLLNLYDFCAAFPSIAHHFISIFFAAIGLPDRLIKYFES